LEKKKRPEELDLLQTIALSNPSYRGYRRNLMPYDIFRFFGPHWEHQGIVTEILGFGVDYFRKLREDRSFLPDLVKRIVK